MHSRRMAGVRLPGRTKCDAISDSGGWIDIGRTPADYPVVVGPHHELFAVSTSQLARVGLGSRRGRDIRVVPIELFAGEETDRPAQRLDAVEIGDLFKHARHHPKIDRKSTRLNS